MLPKPSYMMARKLQKGASAPRGKLAQLVDVMVHHPPKMMRYVLFQKERISGHTAALWHYFLHSKSVCAPARGRREGEGQKGMVKNEIAANVHEGYSADSRISAELLESTSSAHSSTTVSLFLSFFGFWNFKNLSTSSGNRSSASEFVLGDGADINFYFPSFIRYLFFTRRRKKKNFSWDIFFFAFSLPFNFLAIIANIMV